jgi:hypothetical protein
MSLSPIIKYNKIAMVDHLYSLLDQVVLLDTIVCPYHIYPHPYLYRRLRSSRGPHFTLIFNIYHISSFYKEYKGYCFLGNKKVIVIYQK